MCTRSRCPAFDLAGDPEAYPDAGEPWQPLKLYYVSWSIARVKALHEAYLGRGEESAYASWFERGFDKDRTDDFTTLIDVGDYLAKRRAALLAHRTQVDPRATGCACPTTSSARCSRGRSTRSRGRSSTTTFPRASSRTTCSRASGNVIVIVEFVVAAGKKEQARSWARVDDGAVAARGDGAPAEPADVTFTATPPTRRRCTTARSTSRSGSCAAR